LGFAYFIEAANTSSSIPPSIASFVQLNLKIFFLAYRQSDKWETIALFSSEFSNLYQTKAFTLLGRFDSDRDFIPKLGN
jgi:hypothetical protein